MARDEVAEWKSTKALTNIRRRLPRILDSSDATP
jgi:hypothetical protein